jgi:hypothetical protein
MVFYFRMINQPYFMLDLNYKTTMGDILKIIHKPAVLPSKMPDPKPVTEQPKKRISDVRTFASSSSTPQAHALDFRMDGDCSSVGKSEPDKNKTSSRRDSSSVASGGDTDKHASAASNPHVMKLFGPFFEEYRQRKVEQRIGVYGPAVHQPFAQQPVMKSGFAPSPRKAVDLPVPKFTAASLDLKSNDLANAIIDESLSTSFLFSHRSQQT